MANQIIGSWWADNNIDVAEIDGELYALYGWNGEKWTECWKCAGEVVNGIIFDAADDSRSYVVRPILAPIGDPEDDQWDYADFEID